MYKTVVAFVGAAALCLGASDPAPTIRLLSSVPSPQPVGSLIGLTAHVDNAPPAKFVYRYSVSVNGGPFHIVRDFSQQKEFVWSPALHEHEARVRMTMRNSESKAMLEGELPFRIVSRAEAGPHAQPVVTPTTHPLIALLSHPPCPEGSQLRVAFHRAGETAMNYTPLQACRGSVSSNIYVAGMRADTNYELQPEILTAGGSASTSKSGPALMFHTGLLDGDFPPVSVPVPRAAGAAATDPVLFHSVTSMSGPRRPFATDLDGNIIWYLRNPEFLTRVLPGGRFLVLSDGTNSVNDMKRLQIVRELDVAGNVLRETNIGRVAEQLETYNLHSNCKQDGKECVPGFHHDAIRLPNDHTLVVAGIERMLPAGTQNAKEAVDILGDLVIDLDPEFQVSAVWNSFDHMDLKRASLADAKCKFGAGNGGCPPVFLAPQANGWLHSNSLNYIPSTGDFLVSMPEQDWVIKVDWRNGKGTGKVLWRLGADGDFTAKTDDPSPWFSYQHDAGFEPIGSNLLTVLDDGHVRRKKDPKANTRGQVWKLDENTHTATLVLNADLGVYAFAVGSAQSLKNGGYSYEAGFINPAALTSRAVETSADGKVVYAQEVEGIIDYRTFRVADIYSAPVKY